MYNMHQIDRVYSSTKNVVVGDKVGQNWVVGPSGDDRIDTALDEFVFGWSLVQMYGEQTLISGRPMVAMPTRTLPERLAALLLALGKDEGAMGTIYNVSSAELAAALSSSREAVASLLRAFRRQGLIERRFGAIMLTDVDALVELGA